MMAKEVEGILIVSELTESDGISYGIIEVQTYESRMSIRVTKETYGQVPRLESKVKIVYEGDALFRAVQIETLEEAEKKEIFTEEIPKKQLALMRLPVRGLARSHVSPSLLPTTAGLIISSNMLVQPASLQDSVPDTGIITKHFFFVCTLNSSWSLLLH